MFKLLVSMIKRIVTAITSPFRMLIVRVQRMFNINVITAKLVSPLTKKVKSLITLKPQAREDYYVIGRHWIYKKLLLSIVLVLCAGVLIYFTMFAPKLPMEPVTEAAAVATSVSYNYDDMALREFTGVANIRAADGKVVYTGDIAAGVCKGNGTLYDRNGRILYAGGFEQNKYTGKGIHYYPSGKVKYEGEFADNLYQGTGNLYTTGGTLQYAGGFAGGLYSGSGKLYSEQNILLYEGNFSDGAYHGNGVLYYEDGTVKYKGTFFQGVMQGQGALYSKAGKLLYTGDMYGNAINYRSLVHSTLADLEAAFPETPRIFYTDTDSAFVYEQAGVIVTTSCRVLVDTWEKPAAGPEDSTLYYLPDETMPAPGATSPEIAFDLPEVVLDSPETLSDSPVIIPAPIETVAFRANAPQEVSQMSTLRAVTGRLPIMATQMAWYVADGDGTAPNGEQPPVSAPPAAPAPAPPNSSGTASAGAASSPTTPAAPETPAAVPDQGEERPDFVQKSNTLYFEIDKDVWQSEGELDKSKIQIQKITVFHSEIAKPLESAVEFQENVPPSMEDCVAIDFIRQLMPTAFSQVVFEMDNQNHLFVKLANINYAAAIRGRSYLSEDLTYRYCYPANGDDPLFFSIER